MANHRGLETVPPPSQRGRRVVGARLGSVPRVAEPRPESAELERLRALPWTRIVSARPGGGFVGRVRELPQCVSDGTTPAAASRNLEHVLELRLVQIANGDADGPNPDHWDTEVNEFFPVSLPKGTLRRVRDRADRLGVTVNDVIETALDEQLEHDTSRRAAPVGGVLPSAAVRPTNPDHVSETSPRLLDRVVFPEAPGPADHWQRIVLNQAVAAQLDALDPPVLDAAEISGDSHSARPWKSYTSLEYPEFDLCAALDEESRFDVVLCEQVLEHVHDPKAAADNLRRLVRPGGHVVVSTPFLVRVHELRQYGMYDYWRFTPRGLATLLERAGLVVDEVGDWGNRWCVLGNLGHWSSRRPWHPMRREADRPVQVWAFAHRPGD